MTQAWNNMEAHKAQHKGNMELLYIDSEASQFTHLIH